MITLVTDYKDFAIVLTYYLFYNITIFGCFLIICRTAQSNFRTLNNLSEINNSSFLSYSLLIFLCSMAGVPPFAGFFTKILLFKIIFCSGYGFLSIFFLIVAFLGLFFYMQNARFILVPSTPNNHDTNISFNSTSIGNTTLVILTLLLLLLGGAYLNDVLIVAMWLIG